MGMRVVRTMRDGSILVELLPEGRRRIVPPAVWAQVLRQPEEEREDVVRALGGPDEEEA